LFLNKIWANILHLICILHENFLSHAELESKIGIVVGAIFIEIILKKLLMTDQQIGFIVVVFFVFRFRFKQFLQETASFACAVDHF
jgi:hypothetical protein